MICERVNQKFEKTGSAPPALARTVCFCLPFVFALSLFLFSDLAFAASTCGTPGKDGAGSPSGTVNTYYPGTASAASGQKNITLGAATTSGNPTIAIGDRLLIIQMQDADINYTNTSSYGNGSTGSGYTALNSSGYYEFAVAANAVGAGGGTLTVYDNLINSYHVRAATSGNGQSTFQVIRVPQYSSATIAGNVSALVWNGSVGGVAAIDVAGTLTISGSGAINVNGAGFRGGYGRGLGGVGSPTTYLYTDYRTPYSIATNGSMGEGIAGSPYYMNRPATSSPYAPVQVTGGTGYPDGSTSNASYGRGAPGNAGGGSTDGNPAANDENSGGGGGSNYGAGGKGGNSWSSNLVCGGLGGGVIGVGYNHVVMGGGGGAGTTNNSTADGATYSPAPAGIACSSAAACSSGAPGGGIVMLQASSIGGAGTITANGGDGYNVLNDGSGGGGAGGAVVIYSLTGGSATAIANGGSGGNAWRGNTGAGNRHGPGGGGGGGYVAYYSPVTLTGSSSVTGGLCGKSCDDNVYGAVNGGSGVTASYSSSLPGAPSGSECSPNLSTSTKTVVDLTSGGGYYAGDTLQYTITIKESAGHAATVSVSDTIDAYLDQTSVTITTNPSSACSYTSPTLSCAALSVPANGSVTIVYTVPIKNTDLPGTTINNSATITPTVGTGGTAVAPVVTVAGFPPSGSGNKPLYLYDSGTPWKLSRTKPSGLAGTQTLAKGGGSYAWVESPVLASDVTINANVPVTIYLSNGAAAAATRNVEVRLACSSATGTYLGSGNISETNMPITATLYNFTLTVASGGGGVALPMTCAAGNSWQLTIINQSAGGGTRNVIVYPMSGANNSYVTLPSQNVINVNSIRYYNAAYSGGSPLTSVPAGSTVYIRAVVSDPFGNYDIVNDPTITIKNPSGTTIVPATGMGAPVATGSESPAPWTKTYEYAYAVPASPTGNWSVIVTASEGSGSEPTTTVTNTATATMPVANLLPLLTVVKSASPNPSVNPGGVVTYTILVTNTGGSSTTSATVTDPMPTYTTYQAGTTKLNGILVNDVAGVSQLVSGLLVDDNASRTPAGSQGTGILPAGKSATITFQVTVN